MTNESAVEAEIITNKQQQQQSRDASGMPRLQAMLLFVAGVCLLVNALVSSSYHINGSAASQNAAVREAMEDFKRGVPATTKKNLTPTSAKQVAAEEPKARPQSYNGQSKIASLSCSLHGGPNDEFAQKEMVYWSDIHSDSVYVSPFKRKRGERKQYMTFEPDGGGWNNIRMAMETVVGLAIGTGRTLVLPPQKKLYLLGKSDNKQKKHFDFEDFFPMRHMADENAAFSMITMKEFLETEAMAGNLLDKETGKPSFPPGNRTDWNEINQQEYDELREWLRTVSMVPLWRPGQCLATFPSNGNHKSIEELKVMQAAIHKEGLNADVYKGHPVPVDASPIERMKENMAGRKDLCVYNETMQNEMVVHFACYHKMKLRLLVHFYAFLFMEDWKEDLWMKRFMRDHMRYNDEIQCAAARVVMEMRKRARFHSPSSNSDGEYDSFHIRRGDFQFKNTRIPAEEIFINSQEQLVPNSTIFIATDERDKSFFDPLRKHYNIYFLDDFKDVLKDVNSNYFGMIDQLVASRGRIFFGCWFSTFTGFINRIRGYRSVKDKLLGYQNGSLPTTFYYATKQHKFDMHEYEPLRSGFFNREFPTSWRDIDRGIGQLGTAEAQA